MNLETIDTLANVFILVAWPAAALFVIFYGTQSPWYKSFMGRTLMLFAVSMLTLLSLGISTNWVADYEFEPILRFFVYGFVAAMLWRLFFILRSVQTGKLTSTSQPYTPIRDFMGRLYNRRTKNS